MKIFKCLRCFHEWASKQDSPTICPKCKSPYWQKPRGTKHYVMVYLPGHHRAAARGVVHRSVLVLEEKIGRSLTREEEPHHINGIITDDRPDNLELTTHSEHAKKHGFYNYNHNPRNTKGRPFYGNQYVKVK